MASVTECGIFRWRGLALGVYGPLQGAHYISRLFYINSYFENCHFVSKIESPGVAIGVGEGTTREASLDQAMAMFLRKSAAQTLLAEAALLLAIAGKGP